MNHEAGKYCLVEINTILSHFNLKHFIMQGTALGAYRDGGFVPTEKDIDFGILQENLQPVALDILSKLLDNGFDVECFTMPFTKPRTIVATKAYSIKGKLEVAKADIVGLTKWKDKRFTATPIRDWNVNEPYCLVHDANILETYSKIKLFGEYNLIPKNIETYLEREYGKDWKTPQEDHVSRIRIYDFVNKEGISHDYLEQH
jgi:hypothetical protein